MITLAALEVESGISYRVLQHWAQWLKLTRGSGVRLKLTDDQALRVLAAAELGRWGPSYAVECALEVIKVDGDGWTRRIDVADRFSRIEVNVPALCSAVARARRRCPA